MNLVSDILTYMRRYLKLPSNASISDQLLLDYLNRFIINDVDARMQLFDYKTKYQFQTQPLVDSYNMPLYSIQQPFGQPNQSISYYPVYQGFTSPAYINGIQVPLETLYQSFFNIWPNVVQNLQTVATGDGTAGPYTLQLPILSGVSPNPLNPPLNGILRGHVDMTGIIQGNSFQSSTDALDPLYGPTLNLGVPSTSIQPNVFITSTDVNGNNVIVQDSGQFLNDGANQANYGLLMVPGQAPFGYQANSLYMANTYSTINNTVNYTTGTIYVTFPVSIPAGQDINVQCFYFQTGLPRSILYYDNTLTLRSPPDQQYLVELNAYLTPIAFLNTAASVNFGYMSEYLALGAARKIFYETGDQEQLQFYEPFFREQEMLVWKRSQRQWTNNRTPTLYSQGFGQNFGNANSSLGGNSA